MNAAPAKKRKTPKAAGGIPGLVRVRVGDIRPSPENESLYRPVLESDPEVRELASSLGEHGVLQPLTISKDRYLISGHRRLVAARLAGLEAVPCLIEDIDRSDPKFVVLLRENNRQRVKTFDEIVRERVIDVNPKDAYAHLLQERKDACAVGGEFIEIGDRKTRNRISAGKQEMLDRVIAIVNAQREYWPLSDRSIHYEVLNDPPLRHTNKPDSRYVNDGDCYKDLTDILTRARLFGYIPFDAISDPTRTVRTWAGQRDVGGFISTALDRFLTGYFRDLQQSQPNHIEIVGEKNTIEGSIRSVAMEHCIPYTIGRGYCSLDPRQRMAKRFRASGKSQLVVLVLSDFDPDGVLIAHSFAKSMRDDFGIGNILAKSACLTWDQVQERDLQQTFDIPEKKMESKKFQDHRARYGDHFHELEAISSAERSGLLVEAIDSVLDADAYNAELDAEQEDATRLEGLRRRFAPLLREAVSGKNTD